MYAQNGVQRTRKERKVQIAFRPDDNKVRRILSIIARNGALAQFS